MSKARKPLRDRYRHKMDAETRQAIYASLKRSREALAGKIKAPDGSLYDPNLGDRRKNLRKYCATDVIRLALGRYNAW